MTSSATCIKSQWTGTTVVGVHQNIGCPPNPMNGCVLWGKTQC